MLPLFCKLCCGYLNHTIKSSKSGFRKYAGYQFQSQALVVENPVTEIPLPKREIPIINCKNQTLNFYYGQTYDKFQAIPLASRGWRHNGSAGDFFTFYPDAAPGNPVLDASSTSFEEFDLDKQLIHNLKENDLIKSSEIQRISIPVLLSGKNSIIAAETGCGKTLAYLLPLLEQIIRWKRLFKRDFNEPLGLVLSPSRDLTQQLGYVAKKITKDMDIKIRVVMGGRTKQQMLNPIIDDVDLLIGSFGSVSKLTTTGIYKMYAVRHVVLEEADTLLDDSFAEQLRHFLKKINFGFAGPQEDQELPSSAQMTLVSATMPTYLPEILDEIINTDSLVRLTTENLHRILPQVTQKFLRINRSQKAAEILKLVRGIVAKKQQTVIFCNTVKTCDWVYLFLTEMGINCCCTHGNVTAALRSTRFLDFQRGNFNVLATTDACARGLDTVQVKHVINFDFPLYTADYIHRCGRTGRLGNREKCFVTNLISSRREVELLQKIEHAVRTSTALPAVNGNITKVINNKIQKEINDADSFLSRMKARPSSIR